MTFWSKERIEKEQAANSLVEPFNPARIEQCAYALGVAREYAITSVGSNGGGKVLVPAGEHITIPPGQFALLLTEERIAVPPNAMALISMKARFKLRGLINVSGFHVDPGFSGRLKFAVYNAGGNAIDLMPGQELFLIWYSALDQTTKAVYRGQHQNQDGITPEDVMSIRGFVLSPAGIDARVTRVEDELKSELARIESKMDSHQNWSRPLLTAIFVGIVAFLLHVFVEPRLPHASELGSVNGQAVLQKSDVPEMPASPPLTPVKPSPSSNPAPIPPSPVGPSTTPSVPAPQERRPDPSG